MIGQGKSGKTTIYLPPELLHDADVVIQQGKARNRTDLVSLALRHIIDQFNRETLEAEFDEMGRDRAWQEEDQQVMAEFESHDAEAFRTRDQKP